MAKKPRLTSRRQGAVEIKLDGIPKVLRNLAKAKGGISVGLQRGLKRAGLELQRDSQKIVPVDTSALKGSAETRLEAGTSGLNSEILVGYYGIDYAIYVHEDLEAKHAPGKTAKYLEKPARANKEKYRRIIAKEVHP